MKRKKLIFLTSLLTLIPMVIGLLLWNRLPGIYSFLLCRKKSSKK